MKNWIKKIGCMLLVCALFGLSACDLTGSSQGSGFSGSNPWEGNGGNSSNNGGTGGGNTSGGGVGGSEGDSGQAALPEIPDAPTGESVRLPDKLDFTPPAYTKSYAYSYFYGLEDKDKFCNFYRDLYNACIGLGDRDITKTVTVTNQDKTQERTYYYVEMLEYGQYSLTFEEAVSVYKAFRMEYSEFYWIEHTTVVHGTSLVADKEYKNIYLLINDAYVLGETRAQLQTKIEAVANDCYGYLSEDMTATEMALTVYDYIITSLEYAWDGNGKAETAIWAHNIIGLADGGKGVCETYARGYDYLCSLIGFNVLTISGKSQTEEKDEKGDNVWVGHAWNIIKVDGVWYTVDATWGDQTSLYREWFGKSKTAFEKTHESDQSTAFGQDWQYELPTLSEKEISPVRMRDSEGVEKMYACIDYAFADITDENGEYTITLLPDTTVTKKKGTGIQFLQNLDGSELEISFDIGVMPKASKITFVGRKKMEYIGKYHYLKMRTTTAVTLWSGVHLQDIEWSYPAINTNECSITKNHATHGVEIRG